VAASEPESCSELLVADLVAFLHGGVAGFVGTATPEGAPELTRGFAPCVAADRRTIDIFVGRAQGAGCLANLDPGRAIAATLGNVLDYRGIQIKGVCAGWRDAGADDNEWVEEFWRLFLANCQGIGLSPGLTIGLRCRDLVRVTLVPREIFRQTPGPGAGGAVEGGTRWG
jgi:hypothetical protein